MATVTREQTEPIDETILRVAIRRLGVVDADIDRQVERVGEHTAGGVWYWLSVRQRPGMDWWPLARRRTKAELLEFAGVVDPRRLDEKHVRNKP